MRAPEPPERPHLRSSSPSNAFLRGTGGNTSHYSRGPIANNTSNINIEHRPHRPVPLVQTGASGTFASPRLGHSVPRNLETRQRSATFDGQLSSSSQGGPFSVTRNFHYNPRDAPRWNDTAHNRAGTRQGVRIAHNRATSDNGEAMFKDPVAYTDTRTCKSHATKPNSNIERRPHRPVPLPHGGAAAHRPVPAPPQQLFQNQSVPPPTQCPSVCDAGRSRPRPGPPSGGHTASSDDTAKVDDAHDDPSSKSSGAPAPPPSMDWENPVRHPPIENKKKIQGPREVEGFTLRPTPYTWATKPTTTAENDAGLVYATAKQTRYKAQSDRSAAAMGIISAAAKMVEETCVEIEESL